jgi:hypothetical protein
LDPATLNLLFSLYYVIGAFYSFSLLLGPINRALEEWSYLPLLLFLFHVLRLVRVSQKLIFVSNQMSEGGR